MSGSLGDGCRVPSSFETNLTDCGADHVALAARKAVVVSLAELVRIEGTLRRGTDPRTCADYVRKIRTWRASGQASVEVARKLEQLIGQFGNSRFADAARR
jgi:hypothetical protein